MRNEAVSRVWNEWQQNPRFRLGGWIILFIMLAYLLMLLSDWEKGFSTEYRESADRLERLELLARQKEWIERADAAKAISVQMEGRFWKTTSRGLAQAQVQSWLDNLLKNKDIQDARTQVEPVREMTEYEGIWQVAFRIEAAFEPRKLAELLRTAEGSEQIVTVEQLDAVYNKNPRLTLVLKAYFQANSG